MTLMMVKVLAMILDLLEAFLCLPRTFLIHAQLDRLNPNLGYWPTHVGRKGNCAVCLAVNRKRGLPSVGNRHESRIQCEYCNICLCCFWKKLFQVPHISGLLTITMSAYYKPSLENNAWLSRNCCRIFAVATPT